MKRRTLLKHAGLSLVIGPAVLGRPFAAAAQSLEKVTVRLDWTTAGHHAPFYLALRKGWFHDAGIDADIQEGNGSVTTVQIVATGNVEVGHANLAVMMQGRDKGMPVRAIANFVRKNDTGLLVPTDSAIHVVKDLRGKKLLYTAGSLEAPFLDKFLATGGLARSDVELVSVDAAGKMPAYLRGEGDGQFTSVPYGLPFTTSARPSRGILFADVGLQFPGFGLLTTDEQIKGRAAALGRFATMVSGAWEYINAGHQDEGVQAILAAKPNERLDPKILRAHIDAFQPYLTTEASKGLPIGVMAPADFERAVALMREVGMMQPSFKAEDFYTNQLLDQDKIKELGSSV